MAKKLIGTDANQVPINGFLGDLAYQNADNLKRINVNSGTLFVDSENNRVGVGTSSPNSILHIDYTENDADSVINTSQALFVQNGGNGPASIKLNASVSNKHQIVYGGGVGSEFNLVDRLSSGSNRFSVSSNGDISFYEDTGTTPKFFWDASAERLGIGTSSPDTSLSIDNRSASNNEHQVLANFQGQTSTSNGFSRYIIVNDHSRFGAIYNADGGSGWGSLVNGRDSVAISTGDIDAQQNRLIIRDNGETRFRTNNSEAARIDSDGTLLIGTTATGSKGAYFSPDSADRRIFNIGTSTSNAAYLQLFRNPNGVVGSILVDGSSTSYNTSSDYRLKENITDLSDGITRLKNLPVHRFNFIADPETTVDGFIAHEVQPHVPEAVTGEKDGVDEDGNPEYQGIDQAKLVPLLTAALQEAVARIETLEAEVASLKNA